MICTNTIRAGLLPFNRRFLSIESKNYPQTTINEFMNTFYKDLENREDFLHDLNVGLENDDGNMFKSQVVNLLNDKKKESLDSNIDLTEMELHKLQIKIEDITMQFDEYSIFKEGPNIIKILVGNDLICAKDYLYKYIPLSVYNTIIAQFGQYTLEAIIIYVLGLLYNCIQEYSIVRVVTLIDKLDSNVRTQASILNKNKTATSSSPEGDIKRIKGKKYEIGIRLLEFMIERKLIYIETIIDAGKKAVVKDIGKGYLESNLFAVCNFKLSILPLKLNLPMVCKPKEWELKDDVDKMKPLMLSDMRGGYLSEPTLDIYNRFSLISSRNLSNFNIELHDSKYKELCFILNGLQNQGFKINKRMLEFIKRNRATLEKVGFLMSRKLIHVNLKEAYDYLRISYFKNKVIHKVCSLSFLFKELATRLQVARYEDSIIRLASAYDDYIFYLPAFMDFRGRIYRSGILHFHERDLARSLIVFASNPQEVNTLLENDIVAYSAAFKYKKFHLYDEALQWYKENQSVIEASDDSLIKFAMSASDPFQFIAKVLSHNSEDEYNIHPITQDAASSAYQIMSYLLLNEDMARKTNLIQHPDNKIQDVYMYMLYEFKDFVNHKINDKLKMEIIESKLDRKLIKSLFMPLIYGKTIISMDMDIRDKYGLLLSRKDSYNLAKLSIEYLNNQYPDLVNFMKLISIISWFSSVMDRAVVYSITYFTTRQDYMSFIKEKIYVYERNSKKKRRVTIYVPSMKRDTRKTLSSACANFIHQKDAYIAMKVVESLLSQRAPIYTVHDNFITTPPYVRIVPDIYTQVFINMGFPLKIINAFIKINLIYPYYHNNIPSPLYLSMDEEPIPSDYLIDLLNSHMPSNYRTKTKNKIWDQKVSDFVKYYNHYVDAVCDRKPQLNDSGVPCDSLYEGKWNHFKTLLENRSNNYSVHY